MEQASAHIARYKLPKDVVFVDFIQRSPSGKADYRWAAETAGAAAGGTDADVARARAPSCDRRLVLRPFTDLDRAPFAELNAHPLVVESLGSSPTGPRATPWLDRYGGRDGPGGLGPLGGRGGGRRALRRHGRACTGSRRRCRARRPSRSGGGCIPTTGATGYATEAAAASLDYGFDQAGLGEIVAFTTTVNTRSQAVMERIGMVRDPAGDFDHPRLPGGQPAAAPCALPDQRAGVTRRALRARHER